MIFRHITCFYWHFGWNWVLQISKIQVKWHILSHSAALNLFYMEETKCQQTMNYNGNWSTNGFFFKMTKMHLRPSCIQPMLRNFCACLQSYVILCNDIIIWLITLCCIYNNLILDWISNTYSITDRWSISRGRSQDCVRYNERKKTSRFGGSQHAAKVGTME